MLKTIHQGTAHRSSAESPDMITFEQALEASQAPFIQQIDFSAFREPDMINLILQRSEIIRDLPRSGRIVKAWTEGDEKPIRAAVEQIGDELVRRAAAIIWLEYLQIKPALEKIAPRSIADIGCGYAVFDLFAWQDFPGRLLLIDIEESEERHFGFRDSGAAYTSLEVARQFLLDNGVSADDIVTVNPQQNDLSQLEQVDLAVSFISCGFHYPCETYAKFFDEGISPDGSIILDLRKRQAEREMSFLQRYGAVSTLTDCAYGTGQRVLTRKAAD
ncbi:class I SAM-dependent methyltransferase [Marivita sp. S0852]|uniref:class I SAM-dependent methyltransferase n=1 Tax=Marivita sp. S0852 TaxID=3373893 RepID=UPI0039822316